ncbi:murein biosynthesis integral membrane protein MurJ [Anaerovorax odorimutans]|uniref:murein biosynthesis integral membrane protein MurJ n=1 Tax=Anaerovorax odorimutans TaxID=109327 RepID=UPI001FE1B9C0|nr:murein biosynthesis integral membrane protein MurJ [Anaerovorax odorimutans]
MRTAAQTAVLMAILTLISKCFGFVREMVMANFFGTSYITDAYVMAIAVPSVIFGGIFLAVATAYMPLFSKIVENNGDRQGNKFTSEVINLLLIVSIISAIIGLVFSDQIVSIFASGFVGETAKLTSFFIKVTFAYVLFTSAAGILEAYLQYKGVFLVQITIGYIQNIIVIAVMIISAFTSYYYLAVGWLLAHGMRVIILMIIAKKKGFDYTPDFSVNDTIKRITVIAIPVFIGSYIQQINTFVDKTLASGLPEGSVSALNYGMILITLITGLTITVLSTILYPKLNKANSLKQYNRLSELIGTGITLVAIIAVPCALGAMVYSHQIVQIVYERGAFDPAATAMTSTAFFYYAIGLIFMSFNDLMVRAYYSMQDMKIPMIFAGIGVIINIILNLILVKFMQHNGLALATSIAYMANTIMLFIGMKRSYPYIEILKSKKKLLKIILSAVIAVGLSYMVYNIIIGTIANIIYIRTVQLGISILTAGIVYLIMLKIFKVDEIGIIKQIVKR